MKFKLIDAKDVAVLREARKVLKKLKKHLITLEKKRVAAVNDYTLDYKAAAAKNYQLLELLDELDALHVHVKVNDDMRLEAQ